MMPTPKKSRNIDPDVHFFVKSTLERMDEQAQEDMQEDMPYTESSRFAPVTFSIVSGEVNDGISAEIVRRDNFRFWTSKRGKRVIKCLKSMGYRRDGLIWIKEPADE